MNAVETHRCECPEKGVRSMLAGMFGYEPEEEKAREHAPNECPGDYQVLAYLRDGKKIWLCSCCVMSGDQSF